MSSSNEGVFSDGNVVENLPKRQRKLRASTLGQRRRVIVIAADAEDYTYRPRRLSQARRQEVLGLWGGPVARGMVVMGFATIVWAVAVLVPGETLDPNYEFADQYARIGAPRARRYVDYNVEDAYWLPEPHPLGDESLELVPLCLVGHEQCLLENRHWEKG